MFVSCEYIQSTHMALLCQNPKSWCRSICFTRTRIRLPSRTPWGWARRCKLSTLPQIVYVFLCPKNQRLVDEQNNVITVVCACCAMDAASPSVVIFRTFRTAKPYINIGFVFVYQVPYCQCFWGWNMRLLGQYGPGRHRAWYQSLTACRRPLETETLV